jgi:hypothetical protein
MKTRIAAVAASLLSVSTAHALNQSKHYDVTVASCQSAGLPDAFCQRVGVEVYNVDANEFNDLSAHSQITTGSNACDAANLSLWRVFWLGEQIRAVTIAVGYSPSESGHNQLAQHLGRALHTLQDNCAHSGMPNPQHAWHSLSDVCQGTTESPDLNPEAFTCAAAETDAAFSAFIDLLHDSGGDFAQLTNITDEDDKHWPAYGDVCDFLGSANDWDGTDRRWDNSVMRPALTDHLVQAIQGASDAQFTRLCTSWYDDVNASYSDPDFDTSGGAQSCLKIHAFCLGKADSAGAPQPPPWETAQTPAPSAGCSLSGVTATPSAARLVFLIAAALGLTLARKRRTRE